jgi:hypothetical protein
MDDVRPKVLLEKTLAWREKLLIHWIYYCSTNMYWEKIKRLLQARRLLKKQPPAKNLLAALGRLLQCTNIANQRPSVWSKVQLDKSTKKDISSQ